MNRLSHLVGLSPETHGGFKRGETPIRQFQIHRATATYRGIEFKLRNPDDVFRLSKVERYKAMTTSTHSAALPEWPEKPEHTDRMRGIAVGDMVFPESQKLLVLMYYEQARAEAYKCRLELAVAHLAEAIEDIESWAGYASDYFQEKHELKECLAAHRKALTAIGDLP